LRTEIAAEQGAFAAIGTAPEQAEPHRGGEIAGRESLGGLAGRGRRGRWRARSRRGRGVGLCNARFHSRGVLADFALARGLDHGLLLRWRAKGDRDVFRNALAIAASDFGP